MKDFHEAILTIDVTPGMGQVYKKAIEVENSIYREHWSGNHVHVEIKGSDDKSDHLVITLLSHTLPNLQETVEWYEKVGAKVVSTNYREVKQNGNGKD